MSDEVEVTFERDELLEQAMLQAVIADRNAQPRNQQILVGPSSIGFCRELLRAQLFEAQSTNVAQEENWAAAAHVGTVVGEDLERIFGERLGAVTQQRITAYMDKLGVSLSGAMDLLFINNNQVSDLKSTTDIGGVIYDLSKNAKIIETLLTLWREGTLFAKYIETPDGGYELTGKLLRGFSKLHYYVQIAIYVTGAIQAGALGPDGEGRLVFYDRAGDFQEFLALRVTPEMIGLFFEIGQARVEQVATAQQIFEQTGNVYVIHELRDQVPSFCYSPKVMCPLRERCWGGSRWDDEAPLEGAELSSSIDRYIEGRRMAKIGEGMKAAAKAELKGIEGRFEDGRMVTWPGGRINVVETAAGKRHALETKAQLESQEAPADEYSSFAAGEPHLEQRDDGQAIIVEGPEPDPGAYLRPDEHEAQALLDGVVDPSIARLREQQEKVAAERKARMKKNGIGYV